MKKIIFFTLLLGAHASFSQTTNLWEPLPALPERVTNNAVAAVKQGDSTYLYSFCGLDSTKKWSGIHLNAWYMNIQTGVWKKLTDVPDPEGGKIAAAASVVKGKIYVIGGYHVAQSGAEVSSKKVHRFDPGTQSWLTDGAEIPKAIDDQVQCVWEDSLIFVVTGWSNTQNVPNVQIYNPSSDAWVSGNSTPNNNNFKAFGASGVILGDTLYYCGGASGAAGFPAASYFRKGYINPNNPLDITWSAQPDARAKGYRMAAVLMGGHAVWIGGSDVTYNYDGIAYNGSGGVAALSRIKTYRPHTGIFSDHVVDSLVLPPLMDLRGLGQVNDDEFYSIGGMGSDQSVRRDVYKFQWAYTLGTKAQTDVTFISIYPNPASDVIHLETEDRGIVRVFDDSGRLVIEKNDVTSLATAGLPQGQYRLLFETKEGLRLGRFVVFRL